MSVSVILEVTAKPDCLEALKNTLEEILPDTRSFNGCKGVTVMSNQDNPLNLVLLETWSTREHYEKYLAWRAERGDLEALAALLSYEPSIRYFDSFAI